MMKKLAELKVRKSADWKNEIVKALEEAGFNLILEFDGMTDSNYIIAKDIKEDD